MEALSQLRYRPISVKVLVLILSVIYLIVRCNGRPDKCSVLVEVPLYYLVAVHTYCSQASSVDGLQSRTIRLLSEKGRPTTPARRILL